MSSSLRNKRAWIYTYDDSGSAGEMVSTYNLERSPDVDYGWWAARVQVSGREVTRGMKAGHRKDSIFEFSVEAPITEDGAILCDNVQYLVRAILTRDYGQDTLEVYAERSVETLNLVDPEGEVDPEPPADVVAETLTGVLLAAGLLASVIIGTETPINTLAETSPGVVVAAGFAPAVFASAVGGAVVFPDPGSAQLAGFAPTVLANTTADTQTGALLATGTQSTVVVSAPPAVVVFSETGQVTVFGQAPVVSVTNFTAPAAPLNVPTTAAWPRNEAGVPVVLDDDTGVLTGVPIDFDLTHEPVVTGTVHTVANYAQWQAAVAAAVDGDAIEFTAGFTTTQSLLLPAKTTTGWIWIRSSAHGSLPVYNPNHLTAGAADRPDPVADAAALRTITVNADNTPHFRFTGSTRGWWITGLGFALAPGKFNQGAMIEWVRVGGQTTEAQMPSHFVFERNACASGLNIRRCVNLSGKQGAFFNNYLQDFDDYQTNDSQVFWALHGGAHVLIFNNDAGSTSEIVGAGGTTMNIPGFIPHDILVVRNLLRKSANLDGKPELKNMCELKTGRRWAFFGNLLRHYRVGGQFYIWMWTPTNQSGPDTHVTIEDLNVVGNKVVDAEGGIMVISAQGSSSTVNQGMRRLTFAQNFHETAGGGGTSRMLLGCGPGVTQQRDIPDVAIVHNTFPQTEVVLGVSDAMITRAAQWLRFKFKNNAGTNAVRYGAIHSPGPINAAALDAALGIGNWEWAGNLLAKTATSASWGGTLLGAPHNNKVALRTDLYANPLSLDFHVKPAYQGTATDGNDPGADIDWVNGLTDNLE